MMYDDLYAIAARRRRRRRMFLPRKPPRCARYLRVDDTWQCDEGFGGAEIILDRLKASSSRNRE